MSKLAVISLDDLEQRYELRDMIPQAILNQPIDKIAKVLKTQLTERLDDLDWFEGAAVVLHDPRFDDLPIALKHYAGYPAGTTTIYLPDWITSLDIITSVVTTVVRELNLNASDISWQRKDDPDL